jgi:hypothetical protein
VRVGARADALRSSIGRNTNGWDDSEELSFRNDIVQKELGWSYLFISFSASIPRLIISLKVHMFAFSSFGQLSLSSFRGVIWTVLETTF